jgi:hypothetical protein
MQQGWQAYLYHRANPKHTFPLKSEEKDLVQLEYRVDVESYLNSSQKRKLESGTCLLRLDQILESNRGTWLLTH